MTWGSYWGSGLWGQGAGFEAAATRLLYLTRMGPNFRAMADIIDKRYTAILGVLEQILAAFDLDTAVGEQLDVIGEWLGRRREGMLDERYRRALRVQRTSILSSTGTGAVLRTIVEDWTGAPATSYRDIPPARVEIGATVSAEDESLLVQFLTKAKPGGVVLHVLGGPETAYLLGDCGSNPLADPGVADCGSNPITTARPLASELYA